MYKVVITTYEPETLLEKIAHKKFNVDPEVKIQDMQTQQVGVYDIKDFKVSFARKLFQSLLIFLFSTLAVVGGLILAVVFVCGLVTAFAQLGNLSLYAVGLAICAVLLWPLTKRALSTKFEAIYDRPE